MNQEMNIEKILQKAENQQRLIDQLTEENETLYQQFNHLMIRNNKLLKRIDDQQKIIDDLHLRIEELQVINNNQLRLNDHLRVTLPAVLPSLRDSKGNEVDLELLLKKWKSFPGQTGQNMPNLRKQVLLLACLFRQGAMTASQLFSACDIGGVTGARYIAVLKKAGLIRFSGARKKGHYELTSDGLRFIEQAGTSTSGVTSVTRQQVMESVSEDL